MRFSSLFPVAALAAVAVAAPNALDARNNGDSYCNTGSLQCCNSVQSASSPQVALLAGLLGIVLGDLTGQVGLTCNPISVIGVGSGANCVAQPVCCTGNSFNGLIVLGCTPININL